MQTTLKLTALAGALALAGVSGQAAAEAENSSYKTDFFTPTGGELLLQVWDPVAQLGYVRDLGTNFIDIATPTAVAGMSAGTTILEYTADANWANFLGQVDPANLLWGLVVGEAIGNATAYTTTPVGQNVVVPGFNIADQVTGVYDVYIAELNGRDDQDLGADVSSIAAVGEPGYWPNWSDDWLPVEQTAFGQDLAFWSIAWTGSPTTGNIETQFLGAGGAPALWSLGGDGALTFAVVPEAETWALLGLGLLGVGAMARRRSRALPLA